MVVVDRDALVDAAVPVVDSQQVAQQIITVAEVTLFALNKERNSKHYNEIKKPHGGRIIPPRAKSKLFT